MIRRLTVVAACAGAWSLAGCAGPSTPVVPVDPGAIEAIAEPAPGAFRPTPGAPFDPPPGPPIEVTAPVGLDQVVPPHEGALAKVGGEVIDKADLADFMLLDAPVETRLLLDKLVRLRILRREMKRLRVAIPEALVESRVAADRRQLTARAKAKGLAVPSFVLREYGVPIATYRKLWPVLIRTELMRERVVRYSQILEDRVEARIIVVPKREQAVQAHRQLQDGADFATIAKRVSIHRTHGDGGRLPPLGRWGIESTLEDRLFALKEGEITSPIEITEAGRPAWVILKCLRFILARRVSYDDVRDEIEADLERRPFREDEEWFGWIESMKRRYPVEVYLDPSIFSGAETKAVNGGESGNRGG